MSAILKPFANLLNPGPYQVPTGQLAIDWTHPLTNGLLGCWLPGVHYGIDITGQSPTLVPDSGASIRTMNQDGPGLLSNVNGSSLYATAPAAYTSFSTGQFSLFWRGYNLGSTGSNLGWLLGVDSAPNNYVMVTIDGDGGANIQAAWNNAAGIQNTASFGAISTAMTSYGATFVVGTSAPVIGYKNGIQVANSVWGSNSAPPTSGSKIVVNGWPQFVGRYANAICNIACFWNRALSADEMKWLHLEPYSFLTPAEYEMPVLNYGQFWQLYFSKNSGAYSPVTTTSVGVKSADASTDADDTVIRIPRL